MKPKSRHAAASDTTAAVDAFMAALVHPAKKEVAALRAAIVAADDSIREGVKWNAPSFLTTEYFATTNLRAKKGIGLILHFGAKVRDVGAVREAIADPEGLLTWLAADRATISFESMDELKAKTKGLQAIVRQWVRYVAQVSRGNVAMTETHVARTVDEYIAACDPPVRAILSKVRAVIRANAPDAEELISYRMPAYRQRGILVYFGAFSRHLGLFPPVSGDARLEKAIAKYAGPKGNLRFPYDEPIPYELIGRIVALRAKQDRAKGKPARKKA